MQRLGILDGWRGLAIIAVLIGHFTPLPFINLGRFGVEMFFVLSGRLMGELLFIREENLARFYWRRFTRVAPALYGYILVLILFSLLTAIDLGINERSLFAASTFSYNYLHNFGYGAANFDHLWSLCVEEHSYVVLGLVACVLSRQGPRVGMRPWMICLGLAAACMLSGLYQSLTTAGGYYEIYWRTDTRAAAILLGCGLHCLHQEQPRLFEWMNGRTLLLLLAMALCLSLYPVKDCIKYTMGTTLLALCIATLERLPQRAKALLASRPLRYAGLTSFSLYLYQQPFAHAITHDNRLPMLGLAVLCGLMSYYLIEQPARRALNDLTARPVRPQEL